MCQIGPRIRAAQSAKNQRCNRLKTKKYKNIFAVLKISLDKN